MTDENDNSPSFDRRVYQGRVSPEAAPGDRVSGPGSSPIRVSDPDDEEGPLELRLLGKAGALFRVDPETGSVRVAPDADLAGFLRGEGRPEKLYLRIRATDQVKVKKKLSYIFKTRTDSVQKVCGGI